MPILSRRAFAGSGLVILAGAAGVAAEFLRHPRPFSAGPGSPGSTSALAAKSAPVLQNALARERALLARLAGAARSTPALKPTIAILLADHRAHADALAALVTQAGVKVSPSPTNSTGSPSTSSPSTSSPVTAAAVRTWERHAAASILRDCAETSGPGAAVLASIYACEQTHVAWLG